MKLGILFEYGSLNGGEFSMLSMLDQLSPGVRPRTLTKPLSSSSPLSPPNDIPSSTDLMRGEGAGVRGIGRDAFYVPLTPALAPDLVDDKINFFSGGEGEFADGPPVEIQPLSICPEGSPLADELARRKIPCRHLLPFTSGTGWISWLNDIIAESGLQLLHANSLTMAKRLGSVAPSLTCPTTGHIRDIMKLSCTAVTNLNQLRGLAAVSQATKTAHVKQGIEPQKLRTVYNGIDVECFRPGPKTGWLHRELELSPGIQLAATIGQICLRKGQDDLAAAAVLLRDSFPDLHFLLIGQRHSTKVESLEFDAGLTHTLRMAGMEDRLHRLEFRGEIPRLLNEIDLLIHPARQEPLGRVLLEAAACGVPIVATDVGGTSEILTHGVSAWLVPPSSPESLAEGVSTIMEDPVLAQNLGKAARTAITSRFEASSAATQMLAFWRDSLLHPV